MTDPDMDRIQKLGAEARAYGKPLFDNPYLRSEAMPTMTGEGIREWSAKHDAWELGWRCEDMIR